MDQNKKYDICICSTKKDERWIKILYDSIMKYRLPSGVILPDPDLTYNRIYTDPTESEYDEKTEEILASSRYLLIICSPAAGASKPLSDRLVRFKDMNDGENVIAVLVEGEPQESFPPEFIEEKHVRRLMPDMSVVEYTETVEPVASDIRAGDSKEAKQKLRYETVRIVASVLGLHPDVLERRHEKRRQRAIITVAVSASLILSVIAGIFLGFGLKAKHEGDIFTRQTEISTEVAERLTKELHDQFSDIPEAKQAIEEIIAEAQTDLYGEG